jgi:hypothetical protein
MPMRIVALSIVMMLPVFCGSLFAQTTVSGLDSYLVTMSSFHAHYPQERVYVHFDNTSYFREDTIWFKCYVTQSGMNVPTVLSKVLYVDLLSPEGLLMCSQKLRVESGQCHGSFPLLRHYRSGFFEVRAYTRYMMNWGSEWVFSRVLPVYEKPSEEGDYSQRRMSGYKNLNDYFPDRGKSRSLTERSPVNVRFFPEG